MLISQSTRSAESLPLLDRDAQGDYRLATGDKILTAVRQAFGRRVRRGTTLSSSDIVRDYLRAKLGVEHEVFACLLLDSQNTLIEYAEQFRGTLAHTNIYPREVVKIALKRNAAAIIFPHDHPSGLATPSRADELLT
jgi:DNA repair protein RadC